MTQPTYAQLKALFAGGVPAVIMAPGENQESTIERLLTVLAIMASGQNPDGSAWAGFPTSPTGGVQSFNTRVGAVTLTAADVEGVNGAIISGTTNFQGQTFGSNNAGATQTANLLIEADVNIPVACTLTGIQIENGGTATGNVLVALYNAAGTTLLASSASTAQTGTNAAQRIPFSTPLVVAPGNYIMALMFSSSSATAGQSVYLSNASSAAQGGFTLPGSVTPPVATGNFPNMGTY